MMVIGIDAHKRSHTAVTVSVTMLGPQRRLLNRCSAASGGVEKLDIVDGAQLHRRSNCRGVVTTRVIHPASRRDIARRVCPSEIGLSKHGDIP